MRKFFSRFASGVRHQYARKKIREVGIWFVDVPRTSSTSLRAELGERYGVVYAKRNSSNAPDTAVQILADHTRAEEMAQIVGRDSWDQLYTFATVRNPWDRAYSMYKYRRHVECTVPSSMSFANYLGELKESNENRSELFCYPGHFETMSHFLCDEHGKLLVKRLVRFERRAEDLAVIAEELALPGFGSNHEQSTSRFSSESYREAYTSDMVDIVAQVYEVDLRRFNYSF